MATETLKVQKIKDWIGKKQDGLMDAYGNFRSAADEASYNILCNLDAYIDTLQKEPVSEDLEEAIGEYCSNPDNFATWIGGKENDDIPLIVKAIKFGANWQKEQILDCNTTLQRTFELGKQEMKQQMMANAIDMEVKVDAGGYPYIPQIELYDYDKDIPLAKEGDKYKVILIKQE